jgi:hypothetical protein
MPEEEPLRLVLTPEQREMVKRVSGQHVDASELKPDTDRKEGGALRFLWRLSAATGIPRQVWVGEDEASDQSRSS